MLQYVTYLYYLICIISYNMYICGRDLLPGLAWSRAKAAPAGCVSVRLRSQPSEQLRLVERTLYYSRLYDMHMIYVHMYIYIYTHIHTTYIYIYIHTYTCILCLYNSSLVASRICLSTQDPHQSCGEKHRARRTPSLERVTIHIQPHVFGRPS